MTCKEKDASIVPSLLALGVLLITIYVKSYLLQTYLHELRPSLISSASYRYRLLSIMRCNVTTLLGLGLMISGSVKLSPIHNLIQPA